MRVKHPSPFASRVPPYSGVEYCVPFNNLTTNKTEEVAVLYTLPNKRVENYLPLNDVSWGLEQNTAKLS